MTTLYKSEGRELNLPKLHTDADDRALYEKCIADGWEEKSEEAELAEIEAEIAAEESDAEGE